MYYCPVFPRERCGSQSNVREAKSNPSDCGQFGYIGIEVSQVMKVRGASMRDDTRGNFVIETIPREPRGIEQKPDTSKFTMKVRRCLINEIQTLSQPLDDSGGCHAGHLLATYSYRFGLCGCDQATLTG